MVSFSKAVLIELQQRLEQTLKNRGKADNSFQYVGCNSIDTTDGKFHRNYLII
ncbi:hypothetical protein ACVXZY_01460 [Staphylococcus aureus]